MEQEQQNSELKLQVLNKIQEDSVCPHSKWVYSGRECVVWTLWFVTAIFGAVAVAIALFVVMQRQFSFYEATHESFLSFAIEVLPYLWISIFIIMILFAVYNLRHTKTGYRYPLWQILGSSLVLSVAGGTLLHMAGVGFVLDHKIGVFSSHYPSQEKIEEKLWQRPEQGRLVGALVIAEKGPITDIIFFEDVKGIRYETNISELQAIDNELLNTGNKVRILGQMSGMVPPKFHACAVFPWVFEYERTVKELSEMRKEMKERVYRHRKDMQREIASAINQTQESSSNEEIRCADIAMVRRLDLISVQ